MVKDRDTFFNHYHNTSNNCAAQGANSNPPDLRCISYFKMCLDPPKIFGRAQPAKRSEDNNHNDRPVTRGEVYIKTLKNVLEKIATEDYDNASGPEQSDADAYRSHVTHPGASSLLSNYHVRMATLNKE